MALSVKFLWGLFGLCLGSFANVCIFRIPERKSVLWPPSRCPDCLTPIPWRFNVPVLGYIFLKGRCGFCRKPISPLYPLIELTMAAFFYYMISRFYGSPYHLIVGSLLTFYLLVISVIDAKLQIIPDGLSLSLLAVGLALSPYEERLGDSMILRTAGAVAGGLLGFSLMLFLAFIGELIFKKEALGGGDIKLMAAVGTFLGWKGVLAALFAGSSLGTICVLALMLARRMSFGNYLPFGPFLAAGSWLCWTFYDYWTPWMMYLYS